jgi:hypothetical protein
VFCSGTKAKNALFSVILCATGTGLVIHAGTAARAREP